MVRFEKPPKPTRSANAKCVRMWFGFDGGKVAPFAAFIVQAKQGHSLLSASARIVSYRERPQLATTHPSQKLNVQLAVSQLIVPRLPSPQLKKRTMKKTSTSEPTTAKMRLGPFFSTLIDVSYCVAGFLTFDRRYLSPTHPIPTSIVRLHYIFYSTTRTCISAADQFVDQLDDHEVDSHQSIADSSDNAQSQTNKQTNKHTEQSRVERNANRQCEIATNGRLALHVASPCIALSSALVLLFLLVSLTFCEFDDFDAEGTAVVELIDRKGSGKFARRA